MTASDDNKAPAQKAPAADAQDAAAVPAQKSTPAIPADSPLGGGGGRSAMARAIVRNGKYYIFLVAYLVAVSALGSFVNDMYTPALPAMCRFFGCSVPMVQMGLTMGMIGLAVGQLILGPLSDHIGRKPVLIGAISLFVVASVVSIFSPTIHFFITCRLFQGLGAAGGYFLARTIPADIYSGRALAKLMAIVGAINGVAPASAPVIGGFTADAFGWKGIFVVLALFALLILGLSPWVKESLAPDRRSKGGMRQILLGYKGLLTNRSFMVHVWLKGTALGVLFAYISSSPFIMEGGRYGLSQTSYGCFIGVNAVFMAIGSMMALRFRVLKRAAVVGAWILAAGVAAQTFCLLTLDSFWAYEICNVVMLFPLGMIFAAANTLAMNEGRHNAGEASSVLGIAGYIVGAIVSPLVGMGDILHSTAYVFVALALLVLMFASLTRRIPADLQQ